MRPAPSRSPRRVAAVAAALALTLAAAGCSAATGRPGRSAGASGAPLVGGVTDDNVRLPEYLAYVEAYPHQDVPKLDLTDRQVLTVRQAETGLPLWDAEVVVDTPSGPYRVRTDPAGAWPFPRAALGASGLACPVTVDGVPAGRVAPGHDVLALASRPRHTSVRPRLDVALVVDTTGSMGDEVERLRTTLRSVVARLGAHPLHPAVRVGGVAYRDVGDRYVTRPFDFTSDLGAVQRTLDGLDAAGGGDGPEAVQEALDVAVSGLSWGGPGTVRVLFLIGDAPPHVERGVPYTVTMRRALERGIVVFPVACSGMDDRGEFVWRQLAAVTLGQFLFVSYGGGTDHHTGPYLENDLDVLMTRAVLARLDALATGAPAAAPTLVPIAPAPSAPAWPSPYAPTAPPPAWGSPYAPAYAPPAAVRVAPDPGSPSARFGAARDRVGVGRSPWEFGVPGWSR